MKDHISRSIDPTLYFYGLDSQPIYQPATLTELLRPLCCRAAADP